MITFLKTSTFAITTMLQHCYGHAQTYLHDNMNHTFEQTKHRNTQRTHALNKQNKHNHIIWQHAKHHILNHIWTQTKEQTHIQQDHWIVGGRSHAYLQTSNTKQPATINQQTATYTQQPATNNQQTATSNQQPATSNQLPFTNTQQPETSCMFQLCILSL